AEVLDGVGDVDVVPVDAGGVEGPVEHAPGRADERPPGQVLTVARLFPDEHQRGRYPALAEHGLGRVAIQVAGRASARLLLSLAEGGGGLHPVLVPGRAPPHTASGSPIRPSG